MTLEANSLRNLVDKIVEIDSFKSKMGSDDSIVTLAFKVKTAESADDLAGFIERGYPFVLDADKTAGEQSDGLYRVFVEIERNRRVSEQIMELVDGVGKLAEIDDMKYRYYKNFRSRPITQESLDEDLPKTSDEYNSRISETKMQNYKNFFSRSYLEDVEMHGDILTIKKPYADPVQFKFIDFGPTQETLDSINESFNANDFAEIIFLSKYVGDYNITKYGHKLAFENEGNTLVLERIIV
jgi:hypothetical protein